jgi:hypothetical protein
MGKQGGVSFLKAFQEASSGGADRASDLSFGKPVHVHPDQPSGARPHLGFQFGPNAPGQDEATRSGIVVHSPLDRTEHLGYFLPFIQEEGLLSEFESRVRVCTKSNRFSLSIEAHRVGGLLPGRRRLATGTGAIDEDRRKVF